MFILIQVNCTQFISTDFIVALLYFFNFYRFTNIRSGKVLRDVKRTSIFRFERPNKKIDTP